MQLSKYDGSVHPTQFIMTYEAPIASAGGDDPIMAKILHYSMRRSSCKLVLVHPTTVNPKLDTTQGKTEARFSSLQKDGHNLRATIHCIQMDREPLPEYLRRFLQKKAQTPNFSENIAIEKFIEGLDPSQLASHLSREPPRTLSELYSEVKIFAKSDADHKR